MADNTKDISENPRNMLENSKNIIDELKEFYEKISPILKLTSLVASAFSIIISFMFAMTYMRDNGFFSYEIFSINFMWIFLLMGILFVIIHGLYIFGAYLRITPNHQRTKKQTIQAIENDMIEVIYFNDTDNEGLRIRKAKGTDDISGDYNEYKDVETVKVGDVEVTEKGSDGDIAVVIWNDGTYSYAIDAGEAKLNSEAIANLIANIK